MPRYLNIFKRFSTIRMRKIYGILFMLMLLCIGCQWQLKPNNAEDKQISIERYDLIENLYLTTGDYSAMQQLNANYPSQTRMLIEDVLKLGQVNDQDINSKFLHFFQDSTLQAMLFDVQREFADIDDITSELASSFVRLKEELPNIIIPEVYTQVSSFDQSIVVGNNTLGISLDKYLGSDYPFYVTHYTEEQRSMMVRSMIVPDCLGFYILSLYPMTSEQLSSQEGRDRHMGKIQWIVNKVTDRTIFNNTHVNNTAEYMKSNSSVSVDQLLRTPDIF